MRVKPTKMEVQMRMKHTILSVTRHDRTELRRDREDVPSGSHRLQMAHGSRAPVFCAALPPCDSRGFDAWCSARGAFPWDRAKDRCSDW